MHESPDMVTARRAAELTGLNERTIRRRIHRGDMPAVKVAVNRYLIRLADLPPRKRNRLREELDALRTALDALTRRVGVLERAKTSPDALRFDSDGFADKDVPTHQPPPQRPPVAPPSVPFLFGADSPVKIRMVDACRFLERHGINESTPKSWGWLKLALPINEAELLRRTREHITASGWRAGGTRSLHKCTQEGCACAWMLDGMD